MVTLHIISLVIMIIAMVSFAIAMFKYYDADVKTPALKRWFWISFIVSAVSLTVTALTAS